MQKAVYDVSWSPHSSTLFACVTEQAVIVYDLRQNAYAYSMCMCMSSARGHSFILYSRVPLALFVML